MSRRVLIVCDAFGGKVSGAIAANSAATVWTELGFEVGVYTPNLVASDVVVDVIVPSSNIYLQPSFRSIQHFYPGMVQASFDQVLASFCPDVIFFLGTPYSKPVYLLDAAKRSGARTVFMIWNQSFYCARSYAVRDGEPCKKCIEHSVSSFRYGCQQLTTLSMGYVARGRLWQALRQFDVLMCSNQDLADDFVAMGYPRGQVRFCPLFVDAARVEEQSGEDGDYFIFYSQPIEPKGWHLFEFIVTHCPSTKFILCPISKVPPVLSSTIQFFVNEHRVKVVPEITWSTGLASLVAKSRGVLIPSVWPTTTEYVLLEALGLSKPLVAFNVGIHKEILQHEQNAMVADAVDVEQFAQHVQTLDRNPALRQRLSLAAYELYRQMTDPKVYRQSLLDAL